MKYFAKHLLFLGLWSAFFIEQRDNDLWPLFTFACTCSVLLHYLMDPLKNKSNLQYAQLALISLVLICSPSVFLLFLILYIHIASTEFAPIRQYLIQSLIIWATVIFLLLYASMLNTEWGILSFALLVAVYAYKLKESECEEKKELYDALLQEHRQTKRLFYQSEKVARLEERTKIAREIHDSVGHKLTSLIMLLKIRAMSNPELSLEDAENLAVDALQETRHAVRSLKNENIQGLHSVLHLIRKLEAESQINISFATEKGILSAQLTNEQNSSLYRMLQEALTNAMKYSASRDVKVLLSKSAAGDVEFVVSNTYQENKPVQYGFGLNGMNERIETLGGHLTVYCEKDQFIVRGLFPLDKGEHYVANYGG